MKKLVLKFGGSVLNTSDKLPEIAEAISVRISQGYQVWVVVSAFYKATDNLIGLAKKISEFPSKRELDVLVTTGEMITASLLAMTLVDRKIPARSFSGKQAGIITDSNFSDGKILYVLIDEAQKLVNEGVVPIVAGFQGVNENGEVVSLGRGGSDLTAVALGASLQADFVEFYKDVPGIFHSFSDKHQKLCNNKVVPYLNYEDACKIIKQSNRQVIYEKALEYASVHSVRLRVCSLQGVYDDAEGTLIYSPR